MDGVVHPLFLSYSRRFEFVVQNKGNLVESVRAERDV